MLAPSDLRTRPPRHGRHAARLVSAAQGRLRHLLLHFPREAAVRGGYLAVYVDLFATLPASTRLTVLVHPTVTAVLEGLVDASGRTATTVIVEVEEDLQFTVWAQDPCLVLQEADGHTTLVASELFDREEDANTCEEAAVAIGARVQRAAAAFHGGDVLAGDDFVLVGRTCRDLSRDVLGDDRRLVAVGGDRPMAQERSRSIRAAGRDVIEILPGGEGSPHPLVHLDMFLTLAGRGPSGQYRVLVGSTRLADAILGRPVVDEELARHLDDIADHLSAEGFDVVRTPLPLTHGDGRRPVDGQLRDVRLWYLATANNCLVQVDPDQGRHVWVPTYGHGAWRELAAIDAVNRQIWEDLGFTVHELTSFHTFAQRFGALHCIAKVLDRRSSPRAGKGGGRSGS